MNFISLPTGKLHKKTETKKLKNFTAGYVCKFYRNLANNVNNAVTSDTMVGLLTMPICLPMMFKKIYW